jgi:hypothetical protein
LSANGTISLEVTAAEKDLEALVVLDVVCEGRLVKVRLPRGEFSRLIANPTTTKKVGVTLEADVLFLKHTPEAPPPRRAS